MKPVLISEHQNEAQSFIETIETDYLPTVRSIITSIQALGLKPSEDVIRAVLMEGTGILKGEYSSYAERDIPPSSSQPAKNQMRNLHACVFEEFLQSTEPLFEKTIGGKSVKNPMFQDLIAFDETLTPSLPKEGREKIMEQFKEYIIDPQVLKLHKACSAAATGLQGFWQALTESRYASRLMIDFTGSDHSGWMIEKHVLAVLSSFLTITGGQGQYTIEPRQMNFTNVEPEIIEEP